MKTDIGMSAATKIAPLQTTAKKTVTESILMMRTMNAVFVVMLILHPSASFPKQQELFPPTKKPMKP